MRVVPRMACGCEFVVGGLAGLRPIVWLVVAHRAELLLQEIELVLYHF
jgi:hypothetical protein